MERSGSSMNFAEGEVLLFDKPSGWTSFDVVNKVKHIIRAKCGHAGTLDPLATGLLIVCTGKKTKSIDSLQAQEKEYEVEIRFGAVTKSYDSEFPPENFRDASALTRERVQEALRKFTGEIEQVPPVFSAVKVDGKRAYKSAREGKPVELKARRIVISSIILHSFDPSPDDLPCPVAKATVVCSKGTYIRSLAHDVGQALGTGAWMSGLRRTRTGNYHVANAWEIGEFARFVHSLPHQTPNSPSA